MIPELRIKEYDEAIALLDEYKKRVEDGEIMSIVVVAECVDGGMIGARTSIQNVFAMAGYMLTWALRQMNFLQLIDVQRKDQ